MGLKIVVSKQFMCLSLMVSSSLIDGWCEFMLSTKEFNFSIPCAKIIKISSKTLEYIKD